MTRRTLLALLFALATLPPSALLVSPAYADDGGDDGGDDGDGGDDSDDGDDGDDGGDDGGDDNEEGGGSGDGDGDADDHDDALRAVNARDAVPLKRILAEFGGKLEGTVVDVTLIRNTNELRYRVKFIDPKGRVRRAYFDALTGALIR